MADLDKLINVMNHYFFNCNSNGCNNLLDTALFKKTTDGSVERDKRDTVGDRYKSKCKTMISF